MGAARERIKSERTNPPKEELKPLELKEQQQDNSGDILSQIDALIKESEKTLEERKKNAPKPNDCGWC